MGEGNLMVEFQLPKLSARVRFPSLAPVLGLVVLISGCATSRELPSAHVPVTFTPQGVYHKVQKGQTIWRIAQAYDVSIDEIILSNNIPNVAKIEENQLLFIPGAETLKTIPVEEQIAETKEFIWPIKGKVIGFFGERQGTLLNKGIKIQANGGDMVRASRSGRVVFADLLAGYGQTVVIDHEDGFFSVYAHNASLLVALNDRINQGAPLAQVAKGASQLAFIHFEIRKHSVAENPLYYLP